MDTVTITTDDGHELVGQLLLPEAGSEDTRAAVVLHPATGVNQHLYRKFAEHLAGRGWPTFVYDLRGSGLSEQPGDAKNKDMKMSDWILHDVPAATRWLQERYAQQERRIRALEQVVDATEGPFARRMLLVLTAPASRLTEAVRARRR